MKQDVFNERTFERTSFLGEFCLIIEKIFSLYLVLNCLRYILRNVAHMYIVFYMFLSLYDFRVVYIVFYALGKPKRELP